MKQNIAYISLVVKDHDEAIDFNTKKLNFILIEATYLVEQNRGLFALEQSINYTKEVFVGGSVFVNSAIDSILEKAIKLTRKMYVFTSYGLLAATSIIGLHIDIIKRIGISLRSILDKLKRHNKMKKMQQLLVLLFVFISFSSEGSSNLLLKALCTIVNRTMS